jgi:hypothetical protein
MGKSIYRKLSGRKRGLFGYSQLWLAADHVLLLKSTGFTEQYQRFALADIQAITITESRDATIYQFVAGLAAILSMLAFLAIRMAFLKYFFLVTGILILAAVIVDVARGPRCRCHLSTAVSRELLRPVARIRAARSLMMTLTPAIEAVQGTLGPAEETVVTLPAPGFDKPPEIPESAGFLPEVVFSLFLLDALLILLEMRFPQSGIGGVLPTTIFAEIVLVIVALVRRSGRDARRAIYVLMMLALIGIGWDVVEIGRNLGVWINVIIETGKQDKPLEVFNRAASQRTAAIAAIWRIVAGATGLTACMLGRASK